MSQLANFHCAFIHKTHGTYYFHNHEYIEIIYYSSGSGHVEMADGKTFNFNDNSVIIHPPEMMHNQFNKIPGHDFCLIIEYPINFKSSLIINRLTDPRLRNEIMSLANSKMIHNQTDQKIYNLRATAVLLELIEYSSKSSDEKNADDSLDAQLSEVHAHIQNNFDTIGNLDKLYEMFFLSPDYLRHQFTAKYGTSPKNFVLSLRLEHAKKLLKLSALPQKQIALQCGFNNIRYFNTRFHHYFGITPGEFRTQNKLTSCEKIQ